MNTNQQVVEVARKWGLYPQSEKSKAYWLFEKGYRPCDVIASGLVDLTYATVYHYHSLWRNGLKY